MNVVISLLNPEIISLILIVFIGFMLTLIAIMIYKVDIRIMRMEKRINKLTKFVYDNQSKWSYDKAQILSIPYKDINGPYVRYNINDTKMLIELNEKLQKVGDIEYGRKI